jgi:hypothetical protein
MYALACCNASAFVVNVAVAGLAPGPEKFPLQESVSQMKHSLIRKIAKNLRGRRIDVHLQFFAELTTEMPPAYELLN